MLCMLPDTGERYLTTPLFEGIAEDMNEEEEALQVHARLSDGLMEQFQAWSEPFRLGPTYAQ